jgi:hypothetical protein
MPGPGLPMVHGVPRRPRLHRFRRGRRRRWWRRAGGRGSNTPNQWAPRRRRATAKYGQCGIRRPDYMHAGISKNWGRLVSCRPSPMFSQYATMAARPPDGPVGSKLDHTGVPRASLKWGRTRWWVRIQSRNAHPLRVGGNRSISQSQLCTGPHNGCTHVEWYIPLPQRHNAADF